MNKKLKFIIAGFAVVAGLASAVSCQDLSKDVDSLSKEVASLKTLVNDLQTKINAGAVITNVASTSTGIEITLSDGKKYTVSNGKDGANGTNGTNGTNGKDGKDGSVITIENGTWHIDGVDTGLAAQGKDGKDGKDGTNGTNGNDGANGADGIPGDYYVPNEETGCFDLYTWNIETEEYDVIPTEISFLAPDTITAIWDDETGTVTFFGVEGLEDGYTIGGPAILKSLVFIPEEYIDGIEGFSFKNFQFTPKVLTNPDSDTEVQGNKKKADNVTDVDPVNVNPATIISYHINPANADLSDLVVGKSTGLKFVVKQKAYVKTRANASADFGATATLKEIKDGIMKVEVAVKGVPATAEQVSMLALEVTTENGVVTSDYATLRKDELSQLAIALPNEKLTDPLVINLPANAADAHYRRASEGISATDDMAYINTTEAWTAGNNNDVTVKASCDLTVKYTSSIDLKDYVAAHKLNAAGTADVATAPQMSDADFEALGLSWDFAVVKNFKIGAAGSETDQINFVTLKDGVFTPKVYETTGEAAIGRTPIVRVALKHGDDVVEYAYIKVYIADKEPALFDAEYKFDDKIAYNCNDKELNTTVEYMNVKIYNVLGLSKAQFHAQFDQVNLDFIPATAPATYANIGDVTENANLQVEGTYTLKWVISKDEIWANAGKEVTHYIKYSNAANPTLSAVIKLVATIDDIQKAYNIVKADYISNYWNDEKTATRYNVAVPAGLGDIDPNHCVFVNDINASFVTWPATATAPAVPGVLKLDASVTNIQYFFCATAGHGISAPQIDGKAVTFSIKNGGLELWASQTGVAEQMIAEISNDPTAAKPNVITLNKTSDLAKKLLNTKQLYVNLGAKGIVCNDPTKEVAITFDGQDHFRADYVRPVDITDVAADNYVDAVDYGEKGSYIAIKDLVSPKDWRGRVFNAKVNNAYPYITYWDFYGPFNIDVDLQHVKCDLNGVEQDIPVTVVLEKKTAAQIQAMTGDATLNDSFGYITYKNNGTGVSDFNLFLNVEVTYGWGKIVQEGIMVPVKATIEE